jgi:hypothetical protein
VARKVEERNAYRVPTMKLEGKGTFLRSGRIWVILRWISKTEVRMNWNNLAHVWENGWPIC